MSNETEPKVIVLVDENTLQSIRKFQALISSEGSQALQSQWALVESYLQNYFKIRTGKASDFAPGGWPP